MPGSFDGPGATVLPNPPATLASFIGQVPASLNIMPGFFNDGTTQTGQFTDFTISQWVNTNLNVTTGLPSFDGTSNCQALIPTATNSTHTAAVDGPQFVATPNTFRFAAIAKPDGYSRIVLSIACFEFSNSTASFGFDLAGGNTNYDQIVGANITIVGGSAHMLALPSGFYLCYFDYFFNSNNSFGGVAVLVPQLFIDNGSGTGARSTSFAGNGTNGVKVLTVSLLPTPMWTLFGTPTFFDDFEDLSTVDISNTQAPGFNWYINDLFAQGAYTTFGWFTNPPSNTTPAEMITQPARSIIQIYEPNLRPSSTTGFDQGVWSVVPNGSGGLIGTSFRGTQVREIFACWNQGLQSEFNGSVSGSAGLAGYSTVSRINGGLNSLNGYRFLEWDTMETFVHTTQTISGTNALHEWSGGASPVSADVGHAAQMYNNMHLGNFTRTTSVWIDGFSDPNAPGWGQFYSFVNGQGGNTLAQSQQLGTYNFSSSAGSQIDGHHICLTFGTSTNTVGGANPIIPGVPVGGQIMQVDWVRVFSPTTPIVYYVYWDHLDGGTDLTIDPSGTILNNTSGTNFEAMRCSALGGKTSGKWYWEYKLSGAGIGSTSDIILGIMNFNASVTTPAYPGSSAQGAGLQYNTAANTNISGVTGDYAGSITWAANDVIGFALDLGAGKCWIHKNGTWLNGAPGGSTDVWSGISAANSWYAAAAVKSTTATITANFGASAFAYTIPSGFSGWTQ